MLTRTWSRFHEVRLRLEHHVPSSRFLTVLWEFFLFVFKQGWACLFGALILSLAMLSKFFWPRHCWLPRYDFLFLAALLIQLSLLLLRMETVREAKVIFLFHVVGTVMELFKTSVGSWVYPEPNFFRIGHVPLFSGFMYASVGSYLARVSRILDMHYTHYPPRWMTIALGALIYLNFFTHHYLPDIRVLLFVLVAIVFGRTVVYFRPYRVYRRMPLLLGFALVALFIWLAEDIGTMATIWLYPHQMHAWHSVRFAKYGAWFLLMIISFILVSFAHLPQPPPSAETPMPV